MRSWISGLSHEGWEVWGMGRGNFMSFQTHSPRARGANNRANTYLGSSQAIPGKGKKGGKILLGGWGKRGCGGVRDQERRAKGCFREREK